MKSNAIRHDKFYAWISQDDRLQAVGEFTYWRDLNIRQWQFVELEKKPDNLTAVSESWSVNCVAYDSANEKFWYGCNDGNLRSSTDNVNYTIEKATGSAITNILIASASGWPIMFFWNSTSMVYNVIFNDSSAWTTVSINESLYRQVIHYSKTFIYFTNWNTIGQVDIDTPWTVNAYGSFNSGGWAFESRDTLIGLTEHANSFWAYDSGGRMYVIDQWIQWVTAVKNFKEVIIGVYNHTDYDLVVTRSGEYYKAMYINWGVWPNSQQLLRRYIYSQYVYNVVNGTIPSDGIRFNFSIKSGQDASFAENNTIVYFIANEGNDDVVYSYGNKNNSLPESLSIISSKREDGTEWGIISAIFVLSGYLYVHGNVWNTRYVEKISLEDNISGNMYQSSGYIVTRVDNLWIYEDPKQAGKLTIGADIPDWTSIKIYYSMDEGSFTLLWTEIWFDEIQGGTWTATLIQRTIPSQTFNELAIKIELLTSDETITPRVFSLQYAPTISKINQ